MADTWSVLRILEWTSDYFARTGGHVLCFGAGGSAVSTVLHLINKQSKGDRPEKFVVVNRSPRGQPDPYFDKARNVWVAPWRKADGRRPTGQMPLGISRLLMLHY